MERCTPLCPAWLCAWVDLLWACTQRDLFAVGVQGHSCCTMAQLSFLSCCAEWEKHRVLRKRARSRSVLVIDCKNRNYISPTLTNMKLNHVVLKPFTEAMAKFGRISKPIALIKEAVREFYDSESQPVEEKPETMDMKLRKEKNIVRTAEAIKAMLTMIKRKWTLWELPRVPWTYNKRSCRDSCFRESIVHLHSPMRLLKQTYAACM